MSEHIRMAAFISGGGSNLQSIIDHCNSGDIPGQVVLVISNKADAYGLERARKAGIDTWVFNRKAYPDSEAAAQNLLEQVHQHHVDVIVLAGYLKKIPPPVIAAYRGRIFNIHPALLPKFGGKGMYGMNVHRAVIEAGESHTGVTIHEVDDIYDNGRIVAQKKVTVLPDDTPEDLARRVLAAEHKLYPRVLRDIAQKLLEGNKK